MTLLRSKVKMQASKVCTKLHSNSSSHISSSEYSQKACEDAEKLCCTVGSTCRCKQFLEGDHPLVWKKSKEVQTGRFISVLRKRSSDAVFLKAMSGCLQTVAMASFRPFGLTSICRVAAWKTSKAGRPDEFARTVSRPSKRMRVDRKAV